MSVAVVTGGAGAIGSQLVRRLLADDWNRVVVVDNLTSGYRWLLPDDPRLSFVEIDVRNMRQLLGPWERPTVFHLAAHFANQNSVDYPERDLETNGQGTLAALLWARDQHAECFVYASAGCSIAGHGVEDPIREDMPVSLDLDTPYQITKALGEFYCNYFHNRGDVPCTRARFFNSYGPGEIPGRYRNVIPNFVWCALRGEPLTITGTGQETRDFIYVDDLVDGLVRCTKTPGVSGEAFNLGTGRETKIEDIAQEIVGLTESDSKIEYTFRREWDKSVRRSANISKAREILGFVPQVNIVNGLECTVEWFRDNRKIIDRSMRGF